MEDSLAAVKTNSFYFLMKTANPYFLTVLLQHFFSHSFNKGRELSIHAYFRVAPN